MGSTTNDVYKDSWELYKYHGEQFNDDIDYYKDFCLGFDTLELFAGYGRLTNPLSAMGIAIETVELSRRFSEFIQLPPHKVHVMDVLDFQPSRQFDRVIAGYNSFCLLRDDQQIREFFTQVERCLKPKGKASLNYYHQDYWDQAVEEEFIYDGQKIYYTPGFDLSQAHQGKGVWIDTYNNETGSFNKRYEYKTKIYQSHEEFCSYLSHTSLCLEKVVNEFGQQESDITEPGWRDFVLLKAE